MSDCLIRITPSEPYLKIPEQTLESVKELLARKIECDRIQIRSSNEPSFIDCGSNLHSISCPNCGSKVDLHWWGKEMDKAYNNSFASLDVCLPCCKKESSLNDLKYDFPCGFACSVVEVLNPSGEITEGLQEQIREIIGSPIRILYARI